MASLLCPFCKQSLDVANFLSQAQGYSTFTDSGNSFCPHCEAAIEFRVRSNALEIGYTYWAGSLHFEGMETFNVPRLRQHRQGDVITFELGGLVIKTGAP